MLSEWRKFKGWSVLEHFLSRPESRIHIKQLARELGVSPQTSNSYLRLYENENILDSEPIGNLVQFRLNNRHPVVRELKRLYVLMRFNESRFIDKLLDDNPDITNIILYGAHASGDFPENYGIDLLIISNSRKINDSAVKKTGNELQKEFNVRTYSRNEWEVLVNKDDEFVKYVQANHIILYENCELPAKTSSSSKQLLQERERSNNSKMNYVYEEE